MLPGIKNLSKLNKIEKKRSYPSRVMRQKKASWVRGTLKPFLKDSTLCNTINNIGGGLAYFIIKGNRSEHFGFFV